MKKPFVFGLFFLVLLYHAEAQQHELRTKAQVEEVTVFLNRAMLTARTNVSLRKGLNKIILTNLPEQIIKESITAKGKGNFILQGVQYEKNYLSGQEKSRRIQELEDSIEVLKSDLEVLNDRLDVYNKEEEMLIKNNDIKSEQEGIIPSELKEMANFYRARLLEIKSFQRRLKDQVKEKQEKRNKYHSQLNQLRSNAFQPTGEIAVGALAEASTRAEIEVRFLVRQAAWRPIYDIRVQGQSEQATLAYKAQVFQNTGMDWEHVQLTLSTADPTSRGEKPQLSPIYLDIRDQPVYQKRSRNRASFGSAGAEPMREEGAQLDEVMIQDKEIAPAGNVSQYTEVNTRGLSTEFEIALKYSIPSTNKPELVDIQRYEVDADYQHSAVPKLEESAYLMARLKGWSAYNLLPGKANIYYEGTFVGTSTINPFSTKEELPISLGEDKQVQVKREKIKDYSEKKFLGGKVTETYGFEITLRNGKSREVQVKLEDQVPISRDKDIEIEVLELSGGEHHVPTGKVKWNVELKAGEKKTYILKYKIKYSKDENLIGNKY